ncbi:uncharacterized protein [Euwallacea similis]|uniref:uncharacterized protein n=1 Tax=Euwallacea similis TaxID=1736056 RepID=UPI00344DAAD1
MSPNIWLWNKSLKSFIDLRLQSPLFQARNSSNLFYNSIKGSVVQVLAHSMDSYLIIDSNTSYLKGFLGDIWNILEEVLGFRSNITKVRFDNGRDMIKRREADVFLAALVYTKNTTKMRFSQPFIRTWYHLYFKLPEEKPADYLHFKAINLKLWIYILSLFVLITICLWITTFIISKTVPGLERFSSISTYFLGVISAFFNTGYDLRLRSFTARLLILLTLIFGVFCYYALSASLVASLAVMDRKMPFTALNQLADQQIFSLCLRNITFVYDNFTNLNHELLPQWVNVVNTEYCPRDMVNWKTISGAICQDNVAVLENRIIMAWALQNVECEIAMLPQRYFDVGNFIVFSESFKKTKAISVM